MSEHVNEGDGVTKEPVAGNELPAPASLLFENRVYDLVRTVAMVVLPALGTLYFTVAQITGLPFGEQVVGIIVAVDTFLGVILGVARKQYNNSEVAFDGHILVAPDEEDGVTDLRVRLDPDSVATKDEVRVKIKRL